MLFLDKIKSLFKYRRLQVAILTIFMVLLSTTSLTIISINYYKTYKSIVNFAKATIHRTGEVIYQQLDCLFKTFEKIPKITDSLIYSPQEVTIQNQTLMSYMKELIRIQPNLSGFFIGINDGSLIHIINLKVENESFFITNPQKPLPSDAMYSIRLVNRGAGEPSEVHYYYDKDFYLLAEEKINPVKFNATDRPWFIGAKNTGGIYWTDIYKYYLTDAPGITVSAPIYDKSGRFIGASGADLSLTALTKFLDELSISKNGRAFIISDQTGEIVLPQNPTFETDALVNPKVISLAFDSRKKSSTDDFVLDDGLRQFLVEMRRFPIAFSNQWQISLIAPFSDFFSSLIDTQRMLLAISLFIFVISGILVFFFSKRISRPITTLANEIDKITHLDVKSNVTVKSNIKEIITMQNSIIALRKAMRSFGRYVPKDVVRHLMDHGKEIELKGEKKEIVVMFSDIVGFTSIAEKVAPDVLMPLLEEYFDQLSKIVLAKEGTIDKYIGDSIMAFWGAPEAIAMPWDKACETALLCHHLLKNFNADRVSKNKPEFKTRFGIDGGLAIVGNIGTEERINYTAIGDVVNSASRLQSTNNIFHTSIIISEHVYEHVKDRFITRPLDLVSLKGKENKVKIYELIASKVGATSILAKDDHIKFANQFTEAYEAYQSQDKEKALKLFEAFLQDYPDDESAKIYISRLK